MDPLADKILVSSALFVFAALDYIFLWMVWVIVIRDAVMTFNRIFALYAGKPIITHVLAKWKTAAQMITIFMILAYINWRNYLAPSESVYSAQYFDFIGISMLIVTTLTIISGVFYVVENRDLLLSSFRKLFRW